MSNSYYINALEKRRASGEFRELHDYSNLIDFWSNDYLGLAKIEQNSFGHHGSTGSRLISGNRISYEKLEDKVADFFLQDAALLYNSGYDANLGLFSCLPQKNDTIIYDELIHASIRDGIRLSHARSYSFKHSDLESLRSKLNVANGEVFVAIESLYSMDGDLADIKSIVALTNEFNAKLIVDEAHSVGIYGDNGQGLVSKLGLDDQVFAKIITLGKAFGLHGAFVLGDRNLKEFQVNFSRSFIFTTAPSPHHVSLINSQIELIQLSEKERDMLFNNILLLNDLMEVRSESPIFNFEMNSIDSTVGKVDELIRNGIAAKSILSPTVAKGSERIRVCLHSFNTPKEIELLASILNK